MKAIHELQDERARRAISAAGAAARDSYEEISQARDELNALEAEGVYVPDYLEERRREAAERVRASVGQRLDQARRQVEAEASRVASGLDRAGRVDAQEIAAATSRIGLVYGDGLRENPDELMRYYRNTFDDPADRRAVEDLAERLMSALPDGPGKETFRLGWERLREELADRLPLEQREARATLGALERAKEYVAAVEQATTAEIRSLVDPRERGNLTAYARARAFEEEAFGEIAIQRTR